MNPLAMLMRQKNVENPETNAMHASVLRNSNSLVERQDSQTLATAQTPIDQACRWDHALVPGPERSLHVARNALQDDGSIGHKWPVFF
jgi:hypothetical protein